MSIDIVTRVLKVNTNKSALCFLTEIPGIKSQIFN